MQVRALVVGPLQTNCYIVAAGVECLVVDPDGGAGAIGQEIRHLHTSPTAVVLTHGHVDHALGSGDVAAQLGVPLLAHPLDTPFLRRVGEDAWIVGADTGAPVVPQGELHHGQKLVVGGQTLEVLHTPGHSPGSVCLLGDGFLLSGDLLFRGGVGRTDLPGGSWETLHRSVKEFVFRLPRDTVVYPGHGPSTTVGEEVELWHFQGWLSRERPDSAG